MSTTPTKISAYDLDIELAKIIEDLKRLQGDYPTLYDRLISINTDLFDADTKKVVQDLITGYHDSSKLAIQRIIDIGTRLNNLEDALQAVIAENKDGTEDFTYDAVYQNVTNQTVKDKNAVVLFTVDYVYTDLAAGKLNYSEKKFKNRDGKDVSVKKTYTYDANDNIKSISTVTTITDPVKKP